jgi:hypothetical protein
MQIAPRVWPADAVHDTVQAVLRSATYRRSLQSSLAGRVIQWIGQWIQRLLDALDGKASARTVALWFAAALAVLVIARLALAARARDDAMLATSRTKGARRGGDPWLAAEQLAGDGRFEEAAHALYRGVLAALVRTERLRLDPSKTSGDYARELRARGSSSYLPFRAFGRRFEMAVYGHGVCDAVLIADLRRLASPFAPRAWAA